MIGANSGSVGKGKKENWNDFDVTLMDGLEEEKGGCGVKKKKYKTAILDKDKIVTGFKKLSIEADNHDEISTKLLSHGMCIQGDKVIVPDECDLPPNKYRLRGEEFMALGHGFPRPKPNTNGVTKDIAIYHGMTALIDLCRKMDSPIARECVDWRDYFKDNLKKRLHEELKKGGGK